MKGQIKKRVAKNIKLLRKQTNLTQNQLAIKMGVAIRYVSRLENDPQNLTLETIEKLSRALNCDISDIICDSKRDIAIKSSISSIDSTIKQLQTLKKLIQPK